jgi:Rrf2 family protein
MHITLEADYAIRIVDLLAHQEERADAKKISEGTEVTLRFALKILHKLVAGGIVKSYKGAKGGYILAKSAEQITLREVIEAVEGPYQLSRCLKEGNTCSRNTAGCSCRFQPAFDDISSIVRAKLEAITFKKI